MNFLNVAIMLVIFLGIMVASMIYYGSRGKKQIKGHFDTIVEAIGGDVTQQNRMHYPHLTTEVDGKPVELFFHLSEGHRKTMDIVYLVMSTPVTLPSATLVVHEGVFTVSPEKGSFNEAAGDYLENLMPGRHVYGTDDDKSAALFAETDLAERLTALNRYPQIVLGPDAITLGKPYGGALDLTVERVQKDIGKLVSLSRTLEAHANTTEPTLA